MKKNTIVSWTDLEATQCTGTTIADQDGDNILVARQSADGDDDGAFRVVFLCTAAALTVSEPVSAASGNESSAGAATDEAATK